MKKIFKKNKLKLLGIFTIIYFILIYIINIIVPIKNPELIGTIVITIIIVATNLAIVKGYEKEKKINYQKILLAITIIGIVLRTVYILYTPITERQHDIEENVGHLAYIETIYETGKLPTHNKWQFYHQPLHHIIAAGWLKINEFCGVDLETSEEGIQILTAIYSGMIILITYSILEELNIKNCYKILAILVIAIHPTFIILSGSINNDILLIMLTSLVLLYLIKWNKNTSIKNTIILAILTALVALTKISGTIVAIPILYVFINKLIKDFYKEKDVKIIKKYIFKFMIFGIISLGLGLSYSIRNKILFNQSIFYVPVPGLALYCGDNSLINRLNIFSDEWKNIYCNPFEDSNIIIYLIKSSLFGEYSIKGNTGKIVSILMIIFNIAIILITLISIIKVIKDKRQEDSISFNMLLIFYITEIVMYMYGNITMPYGCTMDFRYIVPTILIGMIFIVKDISKEKKNLYYKLINSTIILFAMLSVIFELTYMKILSI